MRRAVIKVASVALVILALWELGIGYPVPWWLYASICSACAVALLRRAPLRAQINQLCGLLLIVAVAASLYIAPWTTRKPFLRDLARIRVGMTEAEVRRIMRGYMEGTGWPALPGSTASNAPTTMNIVGSGSEYATEVSPSGQIAIRDSLVFRHSNKSAFNSDWGIISLSNGRVVKIEFSPD